MKHVDVDAILAPYRSRSSNYGTSRFFDHLPMAVAALAAMGADAKRVAAWAERYAAVHDLKVAGDPERAGRERFRANILNAGRSRVMAQQGARLASGIGAAAFHAAIRAAYALERADDDELAAALEAWEREYLELPQPATTSAIPLEVALRELSRVGITVENRSLISTRMGIVARDARFAAVAEFAPRFADLDGLALAAAAAFALSGDFTALHVMTATHAMRILAPHLPDRDRAMQGFWPAFAAAGIVAGTPPTLDPFVLNALRDEAPQAWEPLLEEAVRQDDEHVIKATYTAWRLDMDLPDPVFRAAANRYLLKKSTRPSQAR